MPAPAAQFSPALPWAAGTRGTITLREPVSKADLLNGVLTFINGNGEFYEPADNDGYVDYVDVEENVLFSIAIGDEEETNTLTFNAPQNDNIQRVIVGPAVGSVENTRTVNSNLQTLAVNEQGFVLAASYIGEEIQYSALTQDGINIITAKRLQDYHEAQAFDLLHREHPVRFNATLKLPAAPAVGEVANLPKLKIELISGEGNACIKILHAPSDDVYDNSYCIILKNSNFEPVYWGDEVTNLVYQ